MPQSPLSSGSASQIAKRKGKAARAWQWLLPRLHLLIMLPTLLVLGSSPFLLMARRLRENASIWELTHVYLGLLLVPLSLLLLYYCLSGGRAGQFFPFRQSALGSDIKGLLRGQLPKGGGAGLFSLLEGLSALLLCAAALTGLGWYLAEGSAEALRWRGWHQDVATGFFIVLILHVLAALSHLLDFFRR